MEDSERSIRWWKDYLQHLEKLRKRSERRNDLPGQIAARKLLEKALPDLWIAVAREIPPDDQSKVLDEIEESIKAFEKSEPWPWESDEERRDRNSN